MPGVSIARRCGGIPASTIDRALSAVRFFDSYDVTSLASATDVTVAATGYEGYPTRRVETPEAVVVLEGHLYDVDDVEAHLREVATWVRAGAAADLADWVGDRDGDFVVYVVEKHTSDVAVVTDAFGRLPLYHATVDGTTLLSRELKFVREVARDVGDPVGIDDLGVAQTLLFGYRLGTRTLFAGVERVPPGSLLSIRHDGDGGTTVETTRLYRFDVGEKPHADRRIEENARELVDRFETACRRRVAGGEEAVVGLSGGLDSRAVAAGLSRIGAEFTAATFSRADGSDADEVRAAEAVADALDVDWREYAVEGSAGHRETLLETKQGMNDLRLSFLLDFFEQIDAPFGTTYVTGDGGDKAFPDLSPPRSFDDVDDLVRYVVSANRVFDLEDAADVAGVQTSALLASVRERVESYPEADLRARYVHFLLRERGMNWLSQGEDRNRYYYWSVSPFYALPFFEYAMGCPDEQKRGNELYRTFLSALAPAVLHVEYVNFGAPITSVEYRAKQYVYDALGRHPDLKSQVVGLVKRAKRDRSVSAPEVARRIRRQVAEGTAVEHGLSAEAIDGIASRPAGHSEPAMYALFTLTSLLDHGPDPTE